MFDKKGIEAPRIRAIEWIEQLSIPRCLLRYVVLVRALFLVS